MPTIKELTERRNKLAHDAREVMDSITPSLDASTQTEKRAKVDVMLAERNQINADLDRLASLAEESNAEQRGVPRSGVETAGVDSRSPEERRKATNVALKAYLQNKSFEQRDLTVAADGGVMIPVAAQPPIQATRGSGTILDVVKTLRTSFGDDVRQPLWDATSLLAVDDGTAWTSSVDPTVTGVTIKTGGLRVGSVLLDNKLIQDVEYDLVADVTEQFNQTYAISMASFINNGMSGQSYFTGLAGNVPVGVTTTSATGFDGYKNFPALLGSLDPSYWPNAVWTFNSSAYAQVLQIEDNYGRPIFLPLNDGANTGFIGTILGIPVKINQFQPGIAAGNSPVYLGDMQKGFTFRSVLPGMRIVQSTQRFVELNRLGVFAFSRNGGAPTLANATAYSPIQALAIHA